MIHARGIALLGTMAFVRESYGPEAHDRVLEAMPEASRPSFLGTVREASWRPLRDMAAYVETARMLFAPKDPEYYRKLGRFVGRVEREKGGFKPMVADPSTAMRLAPLLWSSLYDQGRLEFDIEGPKEGLAHVRDFRTNRALCQTNCGAIEGLVSGPESAAHVTEVACVLDGHGHCEMRVVWD